MSAASREGDRYALTMKLFVLGHRHPPVRRLVARALPLMDAFSLAVRQSCHLVVQDRDAAIVVAQASTPGNWEFGIPRRRADRPRPPVRPGHCSPSRTKMQGGHAGALGRHRERGGLCEARHGARRDNLAAGYRIGSSQQLRGVEDIAVPVLAFGGRAVAVLTCPYIQRLDHVAADMDRRWPRSGKSPPRCRSARRAPTAQPGRG